MTQSQVYDFWRHSVC